MQKSVANWFVAALADENATNDNIAKAMYQYYRTVSGVIDTASCAHKNVHYIMKSSDTYVMACSDCFRESTYTVSTNVEYFKNEFVNVGSGFTNQGYVFD
jgi:hypothetical protein